MLFNMAITDKYIDTLTKPALFFVALLICTPFVNTSKAAREDHYDQLPDLGSTAANYLSDHDAGLLGAAFIRQSRYRMPYIYDPELVQYVNDLGDSLLKHSTDADKDYHFYLIDNDVINAFAVPGGHIALHKAILVKSETESELASVVGHEISHVTQQHIARKIEGSRFDSIIALGALLAAAAAGGGEAAQAAFGLSQATIIDRQLRYSRSYEAEADSLGIRLMSKAGYNPAAMPVFFKRLLDENRINESSAPEFMRSHPLTINRIAESSERVKLYPVVEDRDESHFKLMQAKAMAGYAENPSLIRDMYRSKIKLGDNSIATRYGYALALSENNEFDLARQEFKPLLHEYPENVTIALSNANNELEDKNIDKGLDLLEILFTQERAKGNHLIDIYYANSLVLTDRNEEAIPIVRSAIANEKSEPYLHILLSRAYYETGDRMRSYQSRAEYHYLQGNYEFALRQIKMALDLSDSAYETARLNARAVDIVEEIRELEKL